MFFGRAVRTFRHARLVRHLFADAANISQEGKLNILGVFDALQIGALPAVHPRATLVVRLKADEGDEGMHTLAFGWVGPGGEEMWSSSGESAVNSPPAGAYEVDIPVIAAVDLPIQVAGPHSMRIDIDGDLRAELTLHVRVGGPVAPVSGLVS